MAINPAGMVMKLDPVQGLDLTGFSKAMENQAEIKRERERMRLMREQFENQKRHQAEELQFRKEQEAGQTARQKMQADAMAAQDEAAKAAELEKNRLAAETKFGETALSGDYEGAEGLNPTMTSL